MLLPYQVGIVTWCTSPIISWQMEIKNTHMSHQLNTNSMKLIAHNRHPLIMESGIILDLQYTAPTIYMYTTVKYGIRLYTS